MEIIEPLNREIELQRYMDLSKFLHLLESKKLFLSKASNFDDQLEGGINSYFCTSAKWYG